jgi:hypothetical protein
VQELTEAQQALALWRSPKLVLQIAKLRQRSPALSAELIGDR